MGSNFLILVTLSVPTGPLTLLAALHGVLVLPSSLERPNSSSALFVHGSFLAPNINMETTLPFCLRSRPPKPRLQDLSSLCLGPFRESALACSSSCPRQGNTQESKERPTPIGSLFPALYTPGETPMNAPNLKHASTPSSLGREAIHVHVNSYVYCMSVCVSCASYSSTSL